MLVHRRPLVLLNRWLELVLPRSHSSQVLAAALLFSCWVLSSSLQPHVLQHTSLLCPSLSPKVCSDLCCMNWWCYPTISSSIAPFSSCPQSFPASVSFPVIQLFTSGCQSIGATASATVLPLNIQGWFPLGLTGLISLLSRAFLIAQMVKNPPAMPETWVQSLGLEDPLEKGTATHSSILAWRIPRTAESGSYSPWGCKVGHYWATFTLSLFWGTFKSLL